MRFGLWQVVAMVAAAGAVWAAVATAGAAKSPAAKKLRVLIVTGQNRHHKWQETTPAIKAMLEKTGLFTVDVATTPPAKSDKAAWASFKPDFGCLRRRAAELLRRGLAEPTCSMRS